MSAEPYPQLSRYKRKLAMAVGDNRHYRIAEIAPRHFYQTGSKAGITAPEIDEIFQDLCRSLEPALSTATTAAQAAGMPAPTMDAIVGGIRDRAALMTESA
jgi:serine/threonine-protein kinase HipA